MPHSLKPPNVINIFFSLMPVNVIPLPYFIKSTQGLIFSQQNVIICFSKQAPNLKALWVRKCKWCKADIFLTKLNSYWAPGIIEGMSMGPVMEQLFQHLIPLVGWGRVLSITASYLIPKPADSVSLGFTWRLINTTSNTNVFSWKNPLNLNLVGSLLTSNNIKFLDDELDSMEKFFL